MYWLLDILPGLAAALTGARLGLFCAAAGLAAQLALMFIETRRLEDRWAWRHFLCMTALGVAGIFAGALRYGTIGFGAKGWGAAILVVVIYGALASIGFGWMSGRKGK